MFSQENAKTRIVYTKNNNLEIRNLKTGEIKTLTNEYTDRSPSWSPDMDKIVFIRITRYSSMTEFWKTSICIINADGTGFKKLTDGSNADFYPTWTRDGKDKIIFTRYYKKYDKASIFLTSIDSDPGDETLIGDKLNSEIAYSCLKDGRILIGSTRDFIKGKYYLFTPQSGNAGKYELIDLGIELKGYLKIITINPDETALVFQYNESWSFFNFDNMKIFIAELDINKLRIKNIQRLMLSSLDIFNPKWSSDGKYLIYSVYNIKMKKNDIYFYSIYDNVIKKINNLNYFNYEDPCFESSPQ